MPIPIEIGNIIKEYRKQRGITLRELEHQICQALGDTSAVSAQSLSHWENGRYLPYASLLVRLSKCGDPDLEGLARRLAFRLSGLKPRYQVFAENQG